MQGRLGVCGAAGTRRERGSLPLSLCPRRRGGAEAAWARGISHQLRSFMKEGGKNKLSSGSPLILPASSPFPCREPPPALGFGKGRWHFYRPRLVLISLFGQKQSAIPYFSKRGLRAAAVSFLSFNFPPYAVGQLCGGRGHFQEPGNLFSRVRPLARV